MNKRLWTVIMLVLVCVYTNAQDYESEFLRVQKAFEERLSNTQHQLKEYINTYPYTPYVDEVRMMQGVLYTEKGKYKQADKAFEKVNYKKLSRVTEPLYYFYQGYSLVQQKKYTLALPYMQHLKQSENPYTAQAKYYSGYCFYCQKDYPHAMAEFLSIEQNGAFKQVVPYYIVQIYYAQHKYDKVYDRAEDLLKLYPNNQHNDELHRMLGEIYYQDSAYTDAIRHLNAYRTIREQQKKEIVRNDIYLLGMAYYKTGNYREAIDNFKQVKQTSDSISENTCLHLGHSYLRVDDLEKAKLSYAAAIQLKINDQLREEAMYNYAQITYLQGSALGESIQAFQDFLHEYPQTIYANKIHALMADMYMTSKNYKAALEALYGIVSPNAQMLQTMQYLRYQMGIDAFLQGKMQEAIQWMGEVIDNSKQPSEYTTEAYYIRAECQYRLNNYDICLQELTNYEIQSDVHTSTNRIAAMYLKAYAYFNLKQLVSAEQIFRQYITTIDKTDITYADALNRIGDCLFSTRQFTRARNIYKQVVDIKGNGADYALFQCGYIDGLIHKYKEKIQTLETLATNYPTSDYADDALYEIARAQLQLEYNTQAIETYKRLLARYPNSNKVAKSSLELGMTYRTNKDYSNAIQSFKNTIEKYAGTEEAYAALEGLEQLYVETNNVDGYIAYIKSLGKVNMQTTSQEDSLVYITAELQYMMGNYAQAAQGMTTYITKYCPNGRFCTTAHFYAANSLYQLQQYDQAIGHYSELADMTGSPYAEEACMRVAELSYDKKEFRTALYYFQKMRDIASSNKMLYIAQLGVLRCSYNLGDDMSSIEAATQMLNQSNLPEDVKKEALYCRAKALRNTKQYGLSVADLTPLAKEVRTTIGAEAKYMLADSYFQLGAIDTAEEEIMSFTQLHTTQQYWLAKSLILLADINIQREDDFQAKQYLMALQANYHQQDDIQTLIQERLTKLAKDDIEEKEDAL